MRTKIPKLIKNGHSFIHSFISFIPIDKNKGRAPNQLRPAHAYGITMKEINNYNANNNNNESPFPSPHSFPLSVSSTKQWTHSGNYLGALGLLINGRKIFIYEIDK